MPRAPKPAETKVSKLLSTLKQGKFTNIQAMLRQIPKLAPEIRKQLSSYDPDAALLKCMRGIEKKLFQKYKKRWPCRQRDGLTWNRLMDGMKPVRKQAREFLDARLPIQAGHAYLLLIQQANNWVTGEGGSKGSYVVYDYEDEFGVLNEGLVASLISGDVPPEKLEKWKAVLEGVFNGRALDFGVEDPGLDKLLHKSQKAIHGLLAGKGVDEIDIKVNVGEKEE